MGDAPLKRGEPDRLKNVRTPPGAFLQKLTAKAGVRFSGQSRNDLWMGLVFLAFILLPSGILGYFSWRAIQTEKLLGQQRLQESYRQYAKLARKEFDDELEKAEKKWRAAARALIRKGGFPTPEEVSRFAANQPLVAQCFILPSPGEVLYPPDVTLTLEAQPARTGGAAGFLEEHEIFNQLVVTGEDLEYQDYDLDAAIATYRQILDRVTIPDLRAMALSYIGRAQLKQGDWQAAIETFQQILKRYPESRDLNDMYMRFLAQYQIAVALESMRRDEEAVQVLLRLNGDLLERSGEISMYQYHDFLERIQTLSTRLLASETIQNRESYEAKFQALSEQGKKQFSQKYFLQLLNRKLYKAIIDRKHFRPRIYYVADETDDQPYLLAYRFLPNSSGQYVGSIIGIEIDLAQLSRQIFPPILEILNKDNSFDIAIFDAKKQFVIGTSRPQGEPVAKQTLDEPFDFWEVAIYLKDGAAPRPGFSLTTTFGIWFITLLLLSILFGSYLFIRRAWREAYVSRLKSSFVSNVSHELRTPIASIKMLAELMEMQLSKSGVSRKKPAQSAGKYLNVITRECDRLSRLIDNILEFAKIERGTKQFDFEYEVPGSVVMRAVDVFRPYAEAEGFEMKVEIETHLPEIKVDADALSQLILNLLSNAVKYSEKTKKILVRVFRDERYVYIAVTDHGLGIPASERERIFEDFYRIDQRLNTRKQGGIGLGLTLVRYIAQAHGGDVQVKSALGEGSTFTVSLPIPQDELAGGREQANTVASPVA